VIALADYAAEKPFVLGVPHRVLIGTPEQDPGGDAGTAAAIATQRVESAGKAARQVNLER
jgi:hypothetical protein